VVLERLGISFSSVVEAAKRVLARQGSPLDRG
jgi:hypothetical protein